MAAATGVAVKVRCEQAKRSALGELLPVVHAAATVKSLTWDQSTEMALLADAEKTLGIEMLFR